MCTANLKLQDPIGKEDQTTEEICREFLNDRDGDSAAFLGMRWS
jgi:hypothetical protein